MRVLTWTMVAVCLGMGPTSALAEGAEPEAAAASEAKEVEKKLDFGYDKNLWVASPDGKYRADFFGYGQFRYTYDDLDGRDNRSEFSVARVRAGVKGHLLSPKLKYRIYLNVYSGNTSGTDLFDYWLDYGFSKQLAIRGGQEKVPFGNQWNVSAAGLQFVERASTGGSMIWGRDVGLKLHGGWLAGKLSYDLGIYNGAGRNHRHTGTGHLMVGRLTFQPLGSFPGAETDLGKTESPLLKVALGWSSNRDVRDHARSAIQGVVSSLGPSDITASNLYLGFMYRGWSLHAEGYSRKIDPEDAAVESLESKGYHVQSGFFFDPWELAVRYESFDFDDRVPLDERSEVGLGCNYFLRGNRHKVSADLFFITTETVNGDRDDVRARVQWQLQF